MKRNRIPEEMQPLAARRIVYTYEDYCRLPDDGYRYEILDGELIREPAPRPLHQIVVKNLLLLLDAAASRDCLGIVLTSPLDVLLSEDNLVQPDVVFIPRDRWDLITEANVQGAPALVIEVLSLQSVSRDRERKRRVYERFGVQEYWIVDPWERRIERLVLGEGGFGDPEVLGEGDTLTTPLLPGLRFDVRRVFDNPLSYY